MSKGVFTFNLTFNENSNKHKRAVLSVNEIPFSDRIYVQFKVMFTRRRFQTNSNGCGQKIATLCLQGTIGTSHERVETGSNRSTTDNKPFLLTERVRHIRHIQVTHTLDTYKKEQNFIADTALTQIKISEKTRYLTNK